MGALLGTEHCRRDWRGLCSRQLTTHLGGKKPSHLSGWHAFQQRDGDGAWLPSPPPIMPVPGSIWGLTQAPAPPTPRRSPRRRCQRTGQTESREPSGTGLQGVRVCPGSVREGAACPGGDPTRRGSEAAARRPGHRTTALSSVLSTNAICSPARAAASRRSESPSLRRLPAYPAHGDLLGATGFSGGVSVSWGCRDKVPFSPRPGGWKSEAQASVTRVGSSRGLRPWLVDGCLRPASVPCMCVLNPRF